MMKKEKPEFNGFADFAGYVWDYYKWYIIVGAVILITAVSFIKEQRAATEEVFSVAVVNAQAMQMQEPISGDFSAWAGIDPSEGHAIVYESLTKNSYDYAAEQALSVRIAVGALDVAVMDLPSLSALAANSTFADLREVLTEEQLEKLSPFLYYAERRDLMPVEDPPVDAQEVRAALLSPNPGDFAEPVPIGVNACASEVFSRAYTYPEDDGVLAVLINTKRPEMAAKFIEYLFSVN